MNMKRSEANGKFIVLEGLTHVGKSTQVRRLVEWLKRRGIPAVENAEPTNWNMFGLLIRIFTDQLPLELLNREVLRRQVHRFLETRSSRGTVASIMGAAVDGIQLTQQERQILFMADRRVDLETFIIPALELGLWVIQDRYEMSTFAYGHAQGLDIAELSVTQHHILQDGAAVDPYRAPDITCYLSARPEVLVHRQSVSGKKLDAYEAFANLQRVSEGYGRAFATFAGKYPPVYTIDGEGTEVEVWEALRNTVEEKLLCPRV